MADMAPVFVLLVAQVVNENPEAMFRPVGGGPPMTPTGQSGAGTIAALSASSVTFHNDEHGDATCSAVDGERADLDELEARWAVP